MHIVNIITKLSVGGAQETVLRTCARLDSNRFQCTIVAGCDPSPEGELRDRAQSLGCRVVDVPTLHRSIRPLADLRAVIALAKVLRELRPDVVHTHSSKAGVVGRLAARLARVPVVVHTVHGWSFHDGMARSVRMAAIAVERLLARLSQALVVVTMADERTGLDAHVGRPGQYHVVRSGIDVDAVRAAAAQAGPVDDPIDAAGGRTVGTVMRLSEQKDPITFVEAAAIVARQPGHDDVRFVIVGDGPLRGDVERHIEIAALDGRFELTGAVADAIPCLGRFDLFVLSSRWEGLPRVVVEAMAAGIPVVATAVGGVGEVIVDGETGLLVAPRDPAALADAIGRLLDQRGLAAQLASAASARVEQFDERHMADALASLYEELVSAAGRAAA